MTLATKWAAANAPADRRGTFGGMAPAERSPLPEIRPASADADVAVLIPAAGRSLRYGGGHRSKLAEVVGGHAVLARSVAAFLCRADVAQLVVAAHDEAGARELLGPLASDARVRFTPGGHSRAESVLHALRGSRAELPIVAVHDAARPLVSQGLIDRVLTAARADGAAGPATPVHLTIKQAPGPLPAHVSRTIPRHTLWAMQTPQAMRRRDLLYAYDRCPVPLEQVTDDLQLLELAGLPALLVEGEESNLKITYAGDVATAERLLAAATAPPAR